MKTDEHKLGYFFIVSASIFIVLAGIKSSAMIVVPFLLSLFITILLLPLYNFFKTYKFGDTLSLVLVMLLFFSVVFGIAKFVGSSLHDFNANMDIYAKQLNIYFLLVAQKLMSIGIEIPLENFSGETNSKEIMSFATKVMQGVGEIFSDGFVVLFSVIFMLLESTLFSHKINHITQNKGASHHIRKIVEQIKEYMILKAMMSALTGFVIAVALVALGVDYPFLWALVAFLFNFIPNIGSIIAAVPAVLLTLVQLGPLYALVVSMVYVVVNIVVGSILEPKVMGKGLGLSSLVVFLSLVFWGWLLGIVGMLLSIPLTIMIKIVLDDNEKTRWIAVLLGTGKDIEQQKGKYDRKFRFIGSNFLNKRDV